VLTVWSHSSPVTCADVFLILDGLFRRGYTAAISSVELTFDTAGTPLWRFGRDLCSRATVTELGSQARRTLYVGGPRSPWQVRIYQKTLSLVRVEFVLRSTFLRAHGIRRPQDLLRLRKVDLWRLVSFRVVDRASRYALPPRASEPWLKHGLPLPPAMPASIVERELRSAGLSPRRWVIRSDCETLLRKMQRAMIW
jgi:hypothetical protein